MNEQKMTPEQFITGNYNLDKEDIEFMEALSDWEKASENVKESLDALMIVGGQMSKYVKKVLKDNNIKTEDYL